MLIYLNSLETQEEKDKFEQIYYEYRHTMIYVAMSLLKDQHLAEDAVHESFIRLTKNLHKINDIFCPQTKGYLVTIVRNVSLSMLKKQTHDIPIDEYSEVISSGVDLEDYALSKLDFEKVVEQIMALPDIYKDVLYLTYINELSVKEVAKSLDISRELAKKRLQRSRALLAENLKKES